VGEVFELDAMVIFWKIIDNILAMVQIIVTMEV